MVKIRKKTSARQTTHQREKIKHRVAEHKRKAKKQGKKDPTWRSKVKQDPGIPNLFPYKEQLLQEAQQITLDRKQAKAARKELLEDMAASMNLDVESAAVANSAEEDVEEDEEQETNLKTHARSLRSVIDSADILVQVLDARDPLGTRSLALEKDILSAVPAKKLVFVLNKVDLVPKENVAKWLEYFRRSFPTLPFKSSTQLQRAHLTSDTSAPLLTLLKSFAGGSAKSLTVGVIGLPNVGKSSLINTLKRKKSCSVAPTPGWTKEIQYITLEGGLKIMDCPGVVMTSSNEQSQAQQVLRSTVPIEQLEDVVTPVELLLSKCKKEHLMLLYNIPTFDTVQQFLVNVARVKGRLRKGGLPDIAGTARTIIRDWTAGRIPFYTIPPALPIATAAQPTSAMATEDKSDQVLSQFSAEFDLDALFKSADDAAFAGTTASKGVAMAGSLADEGEINGQARLINEQDEEMEEAEPSNAASASKKRKADDGATVTVAPLKKVTFAGDAKASKMFTPAEQESLDASIGQNKAIAKKAKKQKRKQAKVAANAMDADEEPAEVDEVEQLSLGLEARTKALQVSQAEPADDEAYDFGAFFGLKGKLPLDQAA